MSIRFATFRVLVSAALAGALLHVGVGTSSASTSGLPTWSAPVDLSGSPSAIARPELAMSASGQYITSVWASNNVVHTRTSSDYGATWAAVQSHTVASDFADYQEIAMSDSGQYQTIVWRTNPGNNETARVIQTRSSNDYGATWSTTTNLTDPSSDATNPEIAMSTSGQWQTITWQEDAGANRVINARPSQTYGVQWGTALRVSPPTGRFEDPHIAMSDTGEYQTIVWEQEISPTSFQVWSSTSVLYGSDWDQLTASSHSTTSQVDPSPNIAMSASGQYQAISWFARNGSPATSEVRLTSSSNYGATWGTFTRSDPASTISSVYLAMSDSGQYQTLTWFSDDGTTQLVRSRTSSDFGSTFADEVDLASSTTVADVSRVRSVVSASGQHQTVTWAWGGNGARVVYAASSADFGASWATPVPLTSLMSDATFTDTVMSASGSQQAISWFLQDGNNDVVQISIGTIGSSGTSSGPRAQFLFLLPDGRECSDISPVTVQVGRQYELPGADAACVSMPGSVIEGWFVPAPADSSMFGSVNNPFPPGQLVNVFDSQQFTAIIREPILEVEYDANVGTDHACVAGDVPHTTEDGRSALVWVPRSDFAMARTPDRASCNPPDHVLTGWNTRGDGSGEIIELGAPLPATWESSSRNHYTLYAVWRSS